MSLFTNWDEVREKVINENKHLFTGKNDKLEYPYVKFHEWATKHLTIEEQVLLGYELRYEFDFHSGRGYDGVPDICKKPARFESLEKAAKRAKELMGDKKIEWRVMAIQHGLYSLYIDGKFEDYVQIENEEEKDD